MRKYIRYHFVVIVLLSFLFTFLSLDGNCSSLVKRDSTDCLEIAGMVTINDKPQTDVKVQLWLGNEKIDSLDLKKEFKFRFILKRESVYSIVVSRPGFLNRIVSISTKLPKDVSTESLFRFSFEMELIPEGGAQDPFYADFPSANISYNPVIDGFENDDKYSKNIKKAMLKKK
jgi:hypothetical protein